MLAYKRPMEIKNWCLKGTNIFSKSSFRMKVENSNVYLTEFSITLFCVREKIFHAFLTRNQKMKIRMFDEEQNNYLHAQVYAIMNTGIYEQFLGSGTLTRRRFFLDWPKSQKKTLKGSYSRLIDTIVRDQSSKLD